MWSLQLMSTPGVLRHSCTFAAFPFLAAVCRGVSPYLFCLLTLILLFLAAGFIGDLTGDMVAVAGTLLLMDFLLSGVLVTGGPEVPPPRLQLLATLSSAFTKVARVERRETAVSAAAVLVLISSSARLTSVA